MLVENTYTKNENIELRMKANYWQSMHTRAIKRENILKKDVQQYKISTHKEKTLIKELKQQNEALKAEVIKLRLMMFGQKSEKTKDSKPESDKTPEHGDNSPKPSSDDRRKRGKQPGAKGHGRKLRKNLPVKVITHDLPEDEKFCPFCHKPFESFPGTEDSEEIHWRVKLIRIRHKRKRYRATCKCKNHPAIVTAPVPPKLIPKGMFTTEFWTRLLMKKFLFQIPLYRIRQMLQLEGLSVSQGTLTGGMKKIKKLLLPLYSEIIEQSRLARHWQMDETRWMVFEEMEGKKSHQWWLWVIITKDSCVYVLDPSRSAEVPKTHLESCDGIISADRYSAYKTLRENFKIAYCWSHVRRDYIRIHAAYKENRTWANEWIDRINELFHINKQRLKVLSNADAFGVHDKALREALDSMKKTRDQELEESDIHPAKLKALKSLRNHWDGLTIFVDHPEIPMDNNKSERMLRNPINGRKNYYGSGSTWSGLLSAILFTIFQTFLLNHIDPKKLLLAYFQACAENGGKIPENPRDFLPWNLSDEQKDAWRLPEDQP